MSAISMFQSPNSQPMDMNTPTSSSYSEAKTMVFAEELIRRLHLLADAIADRSQCAQATRRIPIGTPDDSDYGRTFGILNGVNLSKCDGVQEGWLSDYLEEKEDFIVRILWPGYPEAERKVDAEALLGTSEWRQCSIETLALGLAIEYRTLFIHLLKMKRAGSLGTARGHPAFDIRSSGDAGDLFERLEIYDLRKAASEGCWSATLGLSSWPRG